MSKSVFTSEKNNKKQRPLKKRRDSDESISSDGGPQNLANQFFFIERATQTPNRKGVQ